MTGSTALVLGTAQLGQAYGIAGLGTPEASEAIAMVRLAADHDVLAIDTAPGYGEAEALIGRAGVSTPVFSKLAPNHTPRASVEASLRRLRRDRLDLLQLHEAAVLKDDPMGIVDEAFALVGDLVAGLGVSVYTAEEFEYASADERFTSVQFPCSVADQRLLPFLDHEIANHKRHLARSVLLQGALLLPLESLPPHLGPLESSIAIVDSVAQSVNRSRLDVLVAFVRDQPGVDCVLLGFERQSQLEGAIGAVCSPELSAAERAHLARAATDVEGVLDPRRWPK